MTLDIDRVKTELALAGDAERRSSGAGQRPAALISDRHGHMVSAVAAMFRQTAGVAENPNR